jgi:hypothetical protein
MIVLAVTETAEFLVADKNRVYGGARLVDRLDVCGRRFALVFGGARPSMNMWQDGGRSHARQSRLEIPHRVADGGEPGGFTLRPPRQTAMTCAGSAMTVMSLSGSASRAITSAA